MKYLLVKLRFKFWWIRHDFWDKMNDFTYQKRYVKYQFCPYNNPDWSNYDGRV